MTRLRQSEGVHHDFDRSLSEMRKGPKLLRKLADPDEDEEG